MLYVLSEFQKLLPVQEQSKFDAEKLVADISNLLSNHIQRQKELVCFIIFQLLFIHFVLKMANI